MAANALGSEVRFVCTGTKPGLLKVPINSTIAGQTVLRLLHKAAGVAEANNHRPGMAQIPSHQLRVRKSDCGLEAQVGIYREMGPGRKGLPFPD